LRLTRRKKQLLLPKMPEEEGRKRADFNPLAYALRMLKSRIRTVHEVEVALARHGAEPEAIAKVVRELSDLGGLDDREFARSWVRTRDRLMPRGEPILRQELLQKGIAKDLINEVLAERKEMAKSEGTASDDDLARELLRRKERTYSNLAPDVRLRRQMAMLQRRGFSYGVIKRILDA